MNKRPGRTVSWQILKYQQAQISQREDDLAAEEPMEIRVLTQQEGRWVACPVAVTMRTPGNDFELATGFLFTEGAIRSQHDIQRISYCTRTNEPQHHNIVSVYLSPGVEFDPARFSRHLYTSSSCGVCSKTSIELVQQTCLQPPTGDFQLAPDYLLELPEKLGASQAVFAQTGGLHAAALFDRSGQPILVREDVGRHNALDKLVGAMLIAGRLPAWETVLMVSGRASFELVQKALMAGISVFAAVGAPSSLAVELAQEFGMTLIGFLKEDRFNLYSGAERLLIRS